MLVTTCSENRTSRETGDGSQIIRVAVLKLTDSFNNLLLRVFRPDQFCLHDADIQITVSGFELVKTFLWKDPGRTN